MFHLLRGTQGDDRKRAPELKPLNYIPLGKVISRGSNGSIGSSKEREREREEENHMIKQSGLMINSK